MPVCLTTHTMKVLELHGYQQSGEVVHKRTGVARRSFPKDTTFVHPDGYWALNPETTDGVTVVHMLGQNGEEIDADSYYAFSLAEGERAFGWWGRRGESFVGMDESVAYVTKLIREGDFDCILAFSQGATATVLALAALAKEGAKLPRRALLISPYWSEELQQISGLEGVALTEIRSEMVIRVIFGEGDRVVSIDGARQLANTLGAQLITHPGGHLVPNLKEDYKQFLLARPSTWTCGLR